MDKTLVLVVGAPKAGTFTIYNSFSRHPQVCVSKMKEPNYFVDAHFNAEGMKRVDNESDYIKQYRHWRSKQFFLEASPSYLRCPKSPEKIASFCFKFGIENIRIIVALRDPVERAFSNWMMDVRQGHQKEGFKEAFLKDYEKGLSRKKNFIQYEYFRSGIYYGDIKRYQKWFGAENVMIISVRSLKKSFSKVFREIENFVGLNHVNNFDEISVHASNEARVPEGRVVECLYNNRILRKIQRLILNDSAKEFIRSRLFKPDPRTICDFLSDAEIKDIYSFYKEDHDLLLNEFGNDIVYWQINE